MARECTCCLLPPSPSQPARTPATCLAFGHALQLDAACAAAQGQSGGHLAGERRARARFSFLFLQGEVDAGAPAHARVGVKEVCNRPSSTLLSFFFSSLCFFPPSLFPVCPRPRRPPCARSSTSKPASAATRSAPSSGRPSAMSTAWARRVRCAWWLGEGRSGEGGGGGDAAARAGFGARSVFFFFQPAGPVLDRPSVTLVLAWMRHE